MKHSSKLRLLCTPLLVLVAGPVRAQWCRVGPDGFGDGSNYGVGTGVVHAGELHVATFNSAGSQVWRHDGVEWEQDTPAWGAGNELTFSGAEYGGCLYLGTVNGNGAEVWRKCGGTWQRVDQGVLGAANYGVTAMGAHAGELYIATANDLGFEVWSYDGAAWTNRTGPWTSDHTSGWGVVEFGSKLYVGTWSSALGVRGQVWTYAGGVWTEEGPVWNADAARSMAVYNGELVVGTVTGQSQKSYHTDGVSWWPRSMNVDYWADQVTGLVPFDGALYASFDTSTCTQDPPGLPPLLRWDGTTWTWVEAGGFGDDRNCVNFVIAEYADRLYVGTEKEAHLGLGGEVWRSSAGTPYCAANVNSTGEPGGVFDSGTVVVATNDFGLGAHSLPPGEFGFFLLSQTQGFVQGPGGSQGNLCLGGSIGRFSRPGEILNARATGSFHLSVDLTDVPTPSGPVAILPGETWNFTAWYRDKNPNATSNFTDGISVTFL